MSSRPSFLFRAAGLFSGAFVVTVFVMIAALFSDPERPINLWLNRYALPLLLAEVGAILALGFGAMLTDRVGPACGEGAVSDDLASRNSGALLNADSPWSAASSNPDESLPEPGSPHAHPDPS